MNEIVVLPCIELKDRCFKLCDIKTSACSDCPFPKFFGDNTSWEDVARIMRLSGYSNHYVHVACKILSWVKDKDTYNFSKESFDEKKNRLMKCTECEYHNCHENPMWIKNYKPDFDRIMAKYGRLDKE
jgi:hypothetical protein